MSDNKNISEQTRTTERGEKTKGAVSHAMQPNSTRTKPSIEKKVAAASKVGPKEGQLPKTAKEKFAARARSLKSSSRTEIRSRAEDRGETPKTPDPKKKGPRKNPNPDAPATQGPKGVLPKEGKQSVADHYVLIGQSICELKASEVQGRFQKNLKNIRQAEKSILAKTNKSDDAAVKNAMVRAGKAKDKNDSMHSNAIQNIVDTGKSKRKDEGLYLNIGRVIAESLGLVSEGKFDYMQDTPEGEAKTRKAQKDTAAAQREKNAKAIKAARGGSVTRKPRSGNPDSIDYPPGGRP